MNQKRSRRVWIRAAALVGPALVLLLVSGAATRGEIDPRFYAVEVSAAVSDSPAEIRLSWPPDPRATSYRVYRKGLRDTAWGEGKALPADASGYVDTDVAVGSAYEYQVSKSTSAGYQGHGYICAGIQAPLVENRGKVILVAANTYALDLAKELERLRQDLVGDGWIVLRRDVSPDDTPAKVRSIIRADYEADPANVKAVFLFGHVPVPYSGNFNPDSHPDHQGAWAADAFYGDMDGNWTDHLVNTRSAERPYNHNVPGDGKLDQNELPSDVELQVGRVDLHNMTCFANKTPARSELDLLRQYLNKDHQFRHGRLPVERRGLVCDNFGEREGEAFAASGWRNFAPFFGAEKVKAVPGWQYFPAVTSESYLWSYGTGGGGWYTCDGIGSSDDFAQYDVKSVFTMFLGSYFGDWDNESNFLRAPLGSTSYTLTVAWAGRPHWFLHHMALGETIGYSTRLSQNNGYGGLYSPQNWGSRQVHVALMGDPTLRMHPVIPPAGLQVTSFSDGVRLVWEASPDSDLVGYHVYRSSSPYGPFTRLTQGAPIRTTSFTDTAGGGSSTYMVRAIKLERSGSGTYFNPSQGIFGTIQSNSGGGVPVPAPVAPALPTKLTAMPAGLGRIRLSWTDNASNETGFQMERRIGTTGAFAVVAHLNPNVTSYTDSGLEAGTLYSYRVRAFNAAGFSPYSAEASAVTLVPSAGSATVEFAGEDRTTRGSWRGAYGTEGYDVLIEAEYPIYAEGTFRQKADWTWVESTPDSRGLERVSGQTRYAGCYFAADALELSVQFNDSVGHRIGLYFVDWENAGRAQVVEIRDVQSGALLDSRPVSDFSGGVYLSWDVKGSVTITVSRTEGPNAVVSGLFFDPAGGAPAVAAPVISPNSGTFADKVLVTLTSPTPGAIIRYTTDGSDPVETSRIYDSPITLSKSATVRARAYLGELESPVSSATFTINVPWTGTAEVSLKPVEGAGSALADGRFQLELRGEPGRRFTIQASPDLLNWTELRTVTLTSGVLQFADPDAGRFGSRFYRAVPIP